MLFFIPLPRRRRCRHVTPEPAARYDNPLLGLVGALTGIGGIIVMIWLMGRANGDGEALLAMTLGGALVIGGLFMMGLATADERPKTQPLPPRPQQPPPSDRAPVPPPPPKLAAHRSYPGDPFDLG